MITKTSTSASSAQDDELVDLATARKNFIPKKPSGKTVAPSTLYRWIGTGIDGVRLSVVYIGTVPHTSRRALQEFFAAVTASRLAKLAGQQAAKSKVVDASDAELEAAGLI
jgi:hypothetical protein